MNRKLHASIILIPVGLVGCALMWSASLAERAEAQVWTTFRDSACRQEAVRPGAQRPIRVMDRVASIVWSCGAETYTERPMRVPNEFAVAHQREIDRAVCAAHQWAPQILVPACRRVSN